ncbi:hypothetical protein [Pseudomonas sp. Irchel 3E19]|uniref:hypothetical protein n=1 Tax=Pseudomonas sp. Irchel 3E19 TaxID=2008981 RepID=UPI000BA3CC41|nr:hypothetical protein [Pseudomonas sp. Irchel 3E19]
MNFLDSECQTGPFDDLEFGLCDDQPSEVAYVALNHREQWIATVKNPSRKRVTFTAIDKCVLKDHEEAGRGRCDCMLTTDAAMYLIELKDWGRSNWQSHALDQLESTIEFLLATHGEEFLINHSPKKAHVCNRKKAPFVEINNVLKRRFSRHYNFRLDIQTTVQID